jgi:iron-sulfur cluster repair protein YtfE (RIC family)
MNSEVAVTPQLKLNEVVRRFPQTVRVFHRFGLDTCCGGAKPIEEAARLHGLELEELLGELNRAALMAAD